MNDNGAGSMLTPTLTGESLACFATDYRNARRRFLDALAPLAIAAHHRPLTYDGQGPSGESLATDAVWIGPHDAPRVVVLISGTHGVEGFAGSAIQIDLLTRLREVDTLPDGLALLVIHALNPHGFAWLRRCNEDGVDLNRNFVDFGAALPVNEGYDQLASAIVPDTSDWNAANARLMGWLASHTQREYELAVSGGQYHHPQGVFYGGSKAAASRHHIEALMHDYSLSSRRLAVIDIHTGLGPYGYGELICDHPAASAGVAQARRWYGDAVTSPEEGTSTSVPKHGLLDYAWHAIMNDESCFVTLEFGTYPVARMFEALRADHWLHAHAGVDWNAGPTRAIKQAIRKQFFPDCDDWKAMVLFQGRQSIDRAIKGVLGD